MGRRWLHYGIPVLMIALALLLRVSVPAIEEAQLRVFDGYQRLSPRVYEPVPVRYVDLDDESLARMGQWPWPRTIVAELIARLANAGAAVVVFDIVFAEPDRTSPSQILPLWPDTPEVRALRETADALPDHDAVLAGVIAQANVVTGFVLTPEATGSLPIQKGSFAFAGDNPLPFLPAFGGAITNLPQLSAGAAGNGTFNLIAEQDGTIRRIPLFMRVGETIHPALSIEALRVAQGARTFILKSSGANLEASFGQSTGLNNIKVGNIEIPVDANGRMWIHFTEEAPERRISAWRVFEADFDPAEVEGMIIFVGTSAAGLKDLRTTPLNPAAAGVEIHVQAVEQALLGHFLKRPDWADGAEIVFMVALGLLLVLLLPHLGALWSAFVGIAGIAAAIGASWTLFTGQLWLLDPIYPSLVVLFVYLAGSLLNFLRTEQEKRQVRTAFGQYLSPALVEQLADDPDRLVLGGEMRDMTLLFCDIRGFTAISERYKKDPQGLTKLINNFLSPMTDLILERRGTIDKYMGDCIMAFWNAPLDDPDHAAHACDSALAMFAALGDLNDARKVEADAAGRAYDEINIGIGLNSGECCVGNMGSHSRFDYSVLGDAVNLAARLEGQSKQYGVSIVIGQETVNRAPDIAALELDLIAVKGKTEAVHIYALLGGAGQRDSVGFRRLQEQHKKMLSAYRGENWSSALEHLGEARVLAKHALDPELGTGNLDTLYALYQERIEHYLEAPPAAEWGGVFVATTK